MKEVLESFARSFERLQEALHAEPGDIARDAAIQRFEFTVELAWKSVQKYARAESMMCRSPKECMKVAFSLSLVADNPQWFAALEDRNLTAHTYNEELAKEIFSRIPSYMPLFEELLNAFRHKVSLS